MATNRIVPIRHPLPSGFKLTADLAEVPPRVISFRRLPVPAAPELLALPAPPIPPTVQSGDLITAAHENTVTASLEGLWANEQWLEGNMVPVSRRVIAGARMTGGGALSADVTLAGVAPSSADIIAAGGLIDPLTTKGDILARSSVTSRFPIGGPGQVLAVDAAAPFGMAWVAASFPPAAHVHAGADITSGLIDPARLGTGTPSAANYLRGDGSWQAVSGGSGSQTPWTSNINAANFSLNNAKSIGIGTSPADVPLLIQKTNCPFALFLAADLSPTALPTFQLTNDGTAAIYFGVAGSQYFDTTRRGNGYIRTDGALTFHTGAGALERMRLSTTGNVSIGTTDETYRLQVQGGRTLLTDATQAYALGMRNSAAGTVVWQGADAAGNWILSAAGGNQIASIDTASNLTVAQTVTSYISNTAHAVLRSNVAGTGFTQTAIEINQTNLAAGTDMNNSPRISFHWTLQVASQIGMDNTGCIRTFNNPGTAYERFAAAAITANGDLTVTSNATITGYVSAGGIIQSGTGLKFGAIGVSDYLMSRNGTDGYAYTDGSQVGYSGYIWRVDSTREVFRIANSGGVTIGPSINTGTATGALIISKSAAGPSRQFKLYLDDNYNFSLGDYGGAGSTGPYAPFVSVAWQTGNVGIGTSAPNQTLTILAPNAAGAANVNQFAIGEQSNNNAFRLKLGYYVAEGAWTGFIQSIEGGAGSALIINPQGGYVSVGSEFRAQSPLHLRNNTRAADPGLGTAAQPGGLFRMQVNDVGCDFGIYGNGETWIQAYNGISALSAVYAISINPRGGPVGIGKKHTYTSLLAIGALPAASTGVVGDIWRDASGYLRQV